MSEFSPSDPQLTEILQEKFEKKESVCHLFCTGCGHLYELTKEDLLEITGKEQKHGIICIETKECMSCGTAEKVHRQLSRKDLLN